MKFKGLLKNTVIIILFGIIFSKLAGYIYRLILSNLGPNDYGTFVLALSITLFLFIISKLGLDAGLQRYISFFDKTKRFGSIKKLVCYSYVIVIVSSVLTSLILFLLSPYLAV